MLRVSTYCRRIKGRDRMPISHLELVLRTDLSYRQPLVH